MMILNPVLKHCIIDVSVLFLDLIKMYLNVHYSTAHVIAIERITGFKCVHAYFFLLTELSQVYISSLSLICPIDEVFTKLFSLFEL